MTKEPGNDYSGNKTIQFITVVSEVGTTPMFSLWHFLTIFSVLTFFSHHFSIFWGEKIFVFFLPANIYGALMSLMACWFILCHTYHYFSATDLLISQLCRESFLWVIFFSSLSDCMYWLIFLSNIPFFELQLYKRYHTCTYY